MSSFHHSDGGTRSLQAVKRGSARRRAQVTVQCSCSMLRLSTPGWTDSSSIHDYARAYTQMPGIFQSGLPVYEMAAVPSEDAKYLYYWAPVQRMACRLLLPLVGCHADRRLERHNVPGERGCMVRVDRQSVAASF